MYANLTATLIRQSGYHREYQPPAVGGT